MSLVDLLLTLYKDFAEVQIDHLPVLPLMTHKGNRSWNESSQRNRHDNSNASDIVMNKKEL